MESGTKIQVRIPSDVHLWLVSWAKENDRSLNGQIVNILRSEMNASKLKKENPSTFLLGGEGEGRVNQ